jgi:hypothetical protein
MTIIINKAERAIMLSAFIKPNSSVGITTGYELNGRDKRFFSTPQHPGDRLCFWLQIRRSRV